MRNETTTLSNLFLKLTIHSEIAYMCFSHHHAVIYSELYMYMCACTIHGAQLRKKAIANIRLTMQSYWNIVAWRSAMDKIHTLNICNVQLYSLLWYHLFLFTKKYTFLRFPFKWKEIIQGLEKLFFNIKNFKNSN